jgi:diguanylate cyclase (GGDEF)-like protein/PAS domain S-box-containing protein
MQGILSNTGDYTAQAGIFTLSPDAFVLGLNAAAEDLLGTCAAELLGQSLLARFAASASRSRLHLSDCLREGRALADVPATWVDAAGHAVPVLLNLAPMLGAGAQSGLAVLSACRVHSAHGLRHFESIVRSSTEAILSCDDDGAIASWNEGAEALYGYPENEMLGQPLGALYAPERRSEAAQLLAHVRNGGHLSDFVTSRRHRDGHEVEVSLSLFRLQSSAGFSEFTHDTGAIRRRMGVLLSWALEDPLTRLANRRALLDRLGVAMRKSERTGSPGALLFIDLDDFKPVNDVYGHATGDQLLKAVCLRLQNCLRDRDLIGRIGGDEFVVVLLDCHSADLALTVAQRIMTGLQLPFPLGDLLVRIGASVGIALNGDTPDAGIEVLLQRADSAMYQAKRAGKGSAVVAPAPEGPADDGVDPKPSALDRAPFKGCEES